MTIDGPDRRELSIIKEYIANARLPESLFEPFGEALRVVKAVLRIPIRRVIIDEHIDDAGQQVFANFCFLGDHVYAEVTNSYEVESQHPQPDKQAAGHIGDLFAISIRGGLLKVTVDGLELVRTPAPRRIKPRRSEQRKTPAKSVPERSMISYYFRNGESFFLHATSDNRTELLHFHAAIMRRAKL